MISLVVTSGLSKDQPSVFIVRTFTRSSLDSKLIRKRKLKWKKLSIKKKLLLKEEKLMIKKILRMRWPTVSEMRKP